MLGLERGVLKEFLDRAVRAFVCICLFENNAFIFIYVYARLKIDTCQFYLMSGGKKVKFEMIQRGDGC